MQTRKIEINPKDLVAAYLPVDYSDSFELRFTSDKKITADDVMIAFWTKMPKWVDALFKLRDWLVKPFGIQPGQGDDAELFARAIRDQGQYKYVETIAKSGQETVISANDKHLRMYLSIKVHSEQAEQQIIATTLVVFNNWLGRAYFFVIYPFHQLIVPSMLKTTIKNL